MRGATESPACAGSSNDSREQKLSPPPDCNQTFWAFLLWLSVYAIIDIIGVRGLGYPRSHIPFGQ
jgi:hypothetical protein